MELSGSNINKKFLIFSQKKAFRIFSQKKSFLTFWKRETPKKFPYILGNRTFLYFTKRKPQKILLQVKLDVTALCRFEQPMFDI